MKQSVKITMVGGKNVGKTSFLHGMYMVMRRGVNNFFLHTADGDADNRLTTAWEALNKSGEERKWPVPTSDTLTRYEFNFRAGLNRTLMSFEWVDYRGGALLEDQHTAQDLIEQLNTSDCLFFCLDGSELRSPVRDRVFEVDNRMCITRAKILLDRLARRVPIVVLITKHDLCRHRLKDDLMADIRLLFDAWLVPGQGWDVLICPVTLGSDLAEDVQGGRIDPKNLHVPLIYAMFSIMVEGLVEQKRKKKAADDAVAQAHQKVSGLSGGFMSRMFKGGQIDAANDEVLRMQNLHTREERELDRIQRDVALLGRELTNAVMYCDGERMTVQTPDV
ncbi:MAG: GTPase domain-containing protein [Planctomycetota bacterium]|nr:GTPase domain-containing protein [Planctomycetota bacterium]